MNDEAGLTGGVDRDAHMACGMLARNRYILRGEADRAELIESTPAAFVVSDGADKCAIISETQRVSCEIQRCTAQVFRFTDHIPEDFTHTHNFHIGLSHNAVVATCARSEEHTS